MKTDELIAALARGVEPERRTHWLKRLALTLAAGFAAAALLVVIGVGVRPDIGVALLPVLLKAGFSAAAAAIVLPLVARLMRPGRPLGWRIGAAILFFALCALAVIVALLGQAPEDRMQAWMGGGFPWCLVFIPLLAIPCAALLVWLMRAFAPTRLTLTGAAIGAVSGAIGAMAYAMYCPVDSVAFVATWYALAIAVCAALGAVIGAKLLRW
jgi:hypothetical protein